MHPQQIEIVQQRFAQTVPLASLVAECFYQRLFDLDPTLRPLFQGDLKQQGEKLVTMLAAAVNGLNQPAAIADIGRRLGQRHAGHGVQPHHYTMVGEALLWTFGLLLALFTHYRSV